MKILSFLFLFLIITSCNAPRAVYDYDQRVNFTEISTYRIYPDLVSNLNQLDEERLIKLLRAGLESKGLSTSENPDIYVNFYASEYEAQSRNNLGLGVGGGGGNVGVGISGGIPLGGPETYLSLTIDFIDAEKDSLIWQAVVDGRVSKNVDPEQRNEQLRKLVEKALKGFPPKK